MLTLLAPQVESLSDEAFAGGGELPADLATLDGLLSDHARL
jgi:hypothetical protein